MFGSQRFMGIIFMDMMCTANVGSCQFHRIAYFPTFSECMMWIPADWCNRINVAMEWAQAR